MDGKVYVQNKDLAMGSSLGVNFANSHMTNLENTISVDDYQPNLNHSFTAAT